MIEGQGNGLHPQISSTHEKPGAFGWRKTVSLAVGMSLLLFLAVHFYDAWRQLKIETFLAPLRKARLSNILAALLLIHLGYLLRALRWRWLARQHATMSVASLFGPTVIGFGSLAIFGRSGELIRPILIARRHHVSTASQFAVWTAERVFDVSASAMLFMCGAWFATGLQQGTGKSAIVLFLVLLFVAAVIASAAISGFRPADWQARLPRFVHTPVQWMGQLVENLRATLVGLRRSRQLLWVSVLSLGMWTLIAFAYWLTLWSLDDPGTHLPFNHVLVLMGFSLFGSALQFPGGGGSQLTIIAALLYVFHLRPDLALVASALLWLTTTAAPLPVALGFAFKQGLRNTFYPDRS